MSCRTSQEQADVAAPALDEPQTASSRWARGVSRAAKVGKGLLKDSNARKLALRHWLEAVSTLISLANADLVNFLIISMYTWLQIDPRHRYGHNLHLYYNVWFNSKSCQSFFYWYVNRKKP